MDRVFKAMADKSRRRMLDAIKAAPGCNVNGVCGHFKMSRIGVMKHLRILESAGLVISKKEGRERRLFINAVPIQMIHDRWMSQYSTHWAQGLARLKYALEADESKKGGGASGPARD
ncbi:MAG: helix-turn-helix transcriptional regulator [Elusimicrobia bacterium]|nr:helix-turn-helix transcriptional regulator [Elusimicrobiota bacterium]